jgi:hypothetical protein
VGEVVFENVFMISPQLTNEAIIGCQFLKEYCIRINFDSGIISYVQEGIMREQAFAAKAECPAVRRNERGVTGESPYPNHSSSGQRPTNPSADPERTFPLGAVHSCSELQAHPTVLTGSESQDGTQLNCREAESRSDVAYRDGASLNGVAESGRLINEITRVKVDTAQNRNDQSRGSVNGVADSNKGLEIKPVKIILPHGQPIFKSKLDSPIQGRYGRPTCPAWWNKRLTFRPRAK